MLRSSHKQISPWSTVRGNTDASNQPSILRMFDPNTLKVKPPITSLMPMRPLCIRPNRPYHSAETADENLNWYSGAGCEPSCCPGHWPHHSDAECKPADRYWQARDKPISIQTRFLSLSSGTPAAVNIRLAVIIALRPCRIPILARATSRLLPGKVGHQSNAFG